MFNALRVILAIVSLILFETISAFVQIEFGNVLTYTGWYKALSITIRRLSGNTGKRFLWSYSSKTSVDIHNFVRVEIVVFYVSTFL